jgi:hypothetical protein
MPDPTWKPLDAAGLRTRLLEVKTLLCQAAAVSLALDTRTLERLAELDRRLREASHGKRPRRYR